MRPILTLRQYTHDLIVHSHDHAQLVFGLSGALDFEVEGQGSQVRQQSWNGTGWDNRDFRRWNNNGWRNDRRYGWTDWRRSNQYLFRPGPYYAPFRSHRYNRLDIGFYLDSLFFQPRFFLNDPYAYRLPPAYGPYQWVRYYDDVVLVDIYTGEVVDVIHDFFW